MHTPGPWTVKNYNADDVRSPTRFAGPCVVYADEDCDTHPIADCSCNHSCRLEHEEVRANARLIAAAPAMLSALQMLQGAGIHPSILRVVDEAVNMATGAAPEAQ
jgi:hypothetical protein